MPNYIAVIRGDGEGCDYTVACNEKAIFYENTTLEKVVDNILQQYTEFHYWANANEDDDSFWDNPTTPFEDRDYGWSSLDIYEISADHGDGGMQKMFDDIRAVRKKLGEKLAEKESEEQDKAEYERLKAKFGE
jgi:acyl carrier protein